MSKWINYRKPTETITTLISSAHKELISGNRAYLKKFFDILLYLGKQGMPLRGHRENQDSNNKGNFLELCDLFSKYGSKFEEKYKCYFNSTSHEIQNELLEFVCEEILNKIVSEINKSGYYSLMVDEARSHKVQELCICVRYFNNYEIKERLLVMKNVFLDRSAESLANTILPYLQKLGIHGIMVGQSYDGASVMSGVNNGVQKIIRDTHEYAVYVHCLAHRVDLVLVTAC